MGSRILETLADRRVRLLLSCLVLLSAVGHRGVQGWYNFDVPERADGSEGHTSIDFGGQWMMGRLLVLGHGQELYSRARHLEVAQAAYRHDREVPGARTHDAERLISFYPGEDSDPVGGPLYPPIHAFVMAPFGMIDDPYLAYRVEQAFLLLCTFIAGGGISYLTCGRWWWSAATSLVLLYPGCRGAIDLGQNSTVTLSLLIWGWAFLVRDRPCWAGVLWGILAFKPVWAMSFLAAFLILQQWRAALAMMATGLALIVVTLPFVGVHSWFDWLHVGSLATDMYAVDRNWIFLSRDLFGIPRRMFLDFDDGKAVRDQPIAALAGWGLWSVVAGSTVLLAWRRRHWPRHVGVLPAFVMLGMFMCAYRFMYYDALLALLAVVVLFSRPAGFFRVSWWPFASWAAVIVAGSLLIENATSPINVEMTAKIRSLRGTMTLADGSTKETAPTIYLGSGDDYPWDTVAAFALWLWCGIQLMRSRISTDPSMAPAAEVEWVGRTPVANSD